MSGLGDHAVVVTEVPADASKHRTSDGEVSGCQWLGEFRR